MGTYFTYWEGRRKKTVKQNVQKKKCFPCKHGNPPCCLLLLYLKKHVVQLSTSVRTMYFLFNVFILFIKCLLLSPHKTETFTFRFPPTLYRRHFQLFYLHLVFYFVIPCIDFLTPQRSKMIMTMYCVFSFFFFLFFFIWCHFVYLECFWKKDKKQTKTTLKKEKKNTRVNANMQLCLFIPIGMIQCWFGMVHKQLRCLQKVDWGGI